MFLNPCITQSIYILTQHLHIDKYFQYTWVMFLNPCSTQSIYIVTQHLQIDKYFQYTWDMFLNPCSIQRIHIVIGYLQIYKYFQTIQFMFFIPCEQIIYIAIYTDLHKWPIPIRFFNPCYEQSIYKANEELKRDICHLHKEM